VHADDFPQFQALMAKLAEVYGKTLTDELVRACWDALRDLPFARVRQLAEQHLRRGKFFPKPVDLRPKEDPTPTVRTPAMDGAFREGEERAIRRLEELRQKDPEEWIRQVAAAKGPDCNAIRLYRQYGNQLWYDLKERCWRV
jgi:hypothetical protein